VTVLGGGGGEDPGFGAASIGARRLLSRGSRPEGRLSDLRSLTSEL
jgi:hypothetical protein